MSQLAAAASYGGPGTSRTDAGRRARRSSPGGDLDGRSGSVFAARASSLDCVGISRSFAVWYAPRTDASSMPVALSAVTPETASSPSSSPKRLGSESAAARSSIVAARALRDSLTDIAARTRDPRIRAVTAVRAPLGCDAVHRANPHRRSQRSHRPRRRSQRGRADRSLRDRRPDTRLQVAHRTTRPRPTPTRSESTPAASPTPNSPTSTRRPTRHAETPPSIAVCEV